MKLMLLYPYILLLKIASHFGVFLGMFIIRFKKHQSIDLKNLRTIYLNRSDRIGDAIISKPFIKLLIVWLQANGCKAEIIVIASQYNKSILADIETVAPNVHVIEEQKNLDAYESNLFHIIIKHINFLYETLSFRWKHGNKRDTGALFLDLTGGGNLLSIFKYKDLHNPIVAGPNIFWASHILDIAIDHSYVHYSKENLIESYIELIEKVFGLDISLRNFIYDHIEEFFHFETAKKKSGICLFVGVKEFRNLPVTTWRKIIHDVSAAFPDESITVLDDYSNLLYKIFSKESFPKNVIIEKNTYELDELAERVSTFAFVAGIDGGGINMIRTYTHSCTIYTFALHNVWCPFTGRYPYKEKSWRHGWQTGVSTLPHSQKVAFMYKKSFWLPTFNITGSREMFRDFDTTAFIRMIREILI